jgi:hypothetical protein
LTDAENLFQAAFSAGADSEAGTDLAILIRPGGGIHIMDSSGWALPSLQAYSGARAVYRVTRNSGQVRVEGRSGVRSCVLESEPAAVTARHLLNAAPSAFYAAPPAGLRLPSGT